MSRPEGDQPETQSAFSSAEQHVDRSQEIEKIVREMAPEASEHSIRKITAILGFFVEEWARDPDGIDAAQEKTEKMIEEARRANQQ